MAVQIQSFQPRMRLSTAPPSFVTSAAVGGAAATSITTTTPAAPRLSAPGTSVVPGLAPPVRSMVVGGTLPSAPGPNVGMGSSFDGRRMRSKSTMRRTVDYNASLINYVQNRVWQRDRRDMRALQPDVLYNHQIVPPVMLLDKPVNCITTRSVRTATNKIKCPIFCTCWTPEGRRLVTGASSGEFTLWNGLTFSFETILQAHDTSVRSMVWSHNDLWMLTADHGGFVKYWQSNMNNVKMYQAHKDPVRGLSFCPTDQKFASCSDDGTVRVWDFFRCYEEKILRGHGADVKCVDWHPHKSLIASGSKDTQQPVKLWDPRVGASLSTIHAHKHTVMDLKWNKNGNWLLTASRDHLIKLFDVRNMKEEVRAFRGHKKEATTLSWHPIHECLFTSGGSDGSIMFWLADNEKEVGSIDEAHDTMVWSLAWHPLGHILVSGSNDHTTKFWTRNRFGDAMRDRYNLNTLPHGVTDDMLDDFEHQTLNPNTAMPGLGLEFGVADHMKKLEEPTGTKVAVSSEALVAPVIPGLDFSTDKVSSVNVSSVVSSSSSNSGFNTASMVDSRSAMAAAMRRKPIYTKPVPKAFERAWTEGRQPLTVGAGASPPHESVGLLGDLPADESLEPFHQHHDLPVKPNCWPVAARPSGGTSGFRGPGDHMRPPGPLLNRPSGPGRGQGRGQIRPSGPRPLLPIPADFQPTDDWQSHGGDEWSEEGPYGGPDEGYGDDSADYGELSSLGGDVDYHDSVNFGGSYDEQQQPFPRWQGTGEEYDDDNDGGGFEDEWSQQQQHGVSARPPSLLDLKVAPPSQQQQPPPHSGGLKRKMDIGGMGPPMSVPHDFQDDDELAPDDDENSGSNQYGLPPDKMMRGGGPPGPDESQPVGRGGSRGQGRVLLRLRGGVSVRSRGSHLGARAIGAAGSFGGPTMRGGFMTRGGPDMRGRGTYGTGPRPRGPLIRGGRGR